MSVDRLIKAKFQGGVFT